MTKPLVSIGLPVFNGEKYLQETLDSLLAQTYHNFELTICDNASTDRTAEICQSYASCDDRIRYVLNESNIGGTANSKKVFDLSTGEYFMWASCHDLWSPDFIDRCVAVLEEQPNVALCYAKSYWIDTEGSNLGPVDGILDTRGLGRKARVNYVLWGFQNGAPIFGLFRRADLANIALGGVRLAPDRAALYEISFLGDIAYCSEATFYFRRTEQAGSVQVYLTKMLGHTPTRKDQRKLMVDMYKTHISAITRNYHSKKAWPGLMLNCIYALHLGYREFFTTQEPSE